MQGYMASEAPNESASANPSGPRRSSLQFNACRARAHRWRASALGGGVGIRKYGFLSPRAVPQLYVIRKMNESDKLAVLRIACEILDGSTPLLLGCRRICAPIHSLGIDREEPFVTFIAVQSETDHLPLNPDIRKLWNAQALVEQDKEITRATEWAKEMVITACQEVVRRFGECG
jgi:hypothetical protein